MTDDPNAAIRATAARVLTTEGRAVTAMAEALPEDFAPAVEAIIATRGRVILSGIGKSGHIARKISSTFASTGTPSAFVHPAEASHGDLGMVMPGDLTILISNSGETAELRDIIAHVARFEIPMIGISGRAGSTLMQAADYRLVLPPAPEACVIGMAPTTSTTLTLALGDALAVAAMERRGFLPEQFRTFHPGGKLGARLSKVAQLMHGDAALPLVDESAPMSETLIVMSEKGFGIARVGGAARRGDLGRRPAAQHGHPDGARRRRGRHPHAARGRSGRSGSRSDGGDVGQPHHGAFRGRRGDAAPRSPAYPRLPARGPRLTGFSRGSPRR
jgi:arabinose-5-phosphate isomerase